MVTPCWSAARVLDERLAVGVVEVHGDAVGGHARLVQLGEQRGDMAGGGDADRVAEAQLVAAHVEQRPADPYDLVRRGPAPSQGSPKHIER